MTLPRERDTPLALSRVNVARAMHAALGLILCSDECAAMSLRSIGCLVAIVRYAGSKAAHHSGCIPMENVVSILAMKGLDAADAKLAVSGLIMSGWIEEKDGGLVVPQFTAACLAEDQAFQNRKLGWEKRFLGAGRLEPNMGEQSAKKRLTDRPGFLATQESRPPKRKLTRASGVPKKSSGQTLGRGGVDDAVLAKFVCKGDIEVVVTKSYAADLSATYPGVDVEQQLVSASWWCQSNPEKRKTAKGLSRFINSWMSSAFRDASIRKSIQRSAKSSNGFGHGFQYGEPGEPQATQSRSELNSDVTHELADLLEADARPPLAHESKLYMTNSHSNASPVKTQISSDLTPFQRARMRFATKSTDKQGGLFRVSSK